MRGLTLAGLIVVALWIFGVIGWIANIVQIVHVITLPITGLFILKCVGILLFPLGVILGWIGMF